MIYYIFYELIFNHSNQNWWLIKALNVFQYVTFRTAYASVTALLISLLSGRKLINALKRWNIGQQIREEGPQAHISKRDTPTMGGLLVIASVLISTLLWARLSSVYVWIIIFAQDFERRRKTKWRRAQVQVAYLAKLDVGILSRIGIGGCQ